MIRFVLGPERLLVADLAERLPGRGIWLSAQRNVVEVARTKGAFARATGGAVTVPPDLLPDLVTSLQRRVGEHIGLARRAGQAVAGYAKTREWLEAGRVAVVVQAADGSAAECRRLLGHRAETVAVVKPLDATRLGALFGREQTVHVGLSAGRLAERVRLEAGRLAGLMEAGGDARAVERDQASS